LDAKKRRIGRKQNYRLMSWKTAVAENPGSSSGQMQRIHAFFHAPQAMKAPGQRRAGQRRAVKNWAHSAASAPSNRSILAPKVADGRYIEATSKHAKKGPFAGRKHTPEAKVWQQLRLETAARLALHGSNTPLALRMQARHRVFTTADMLRRREEGLMVSIIRLPRSECVVAAAACASHCDLPWLCCSSNKPRTSGGWASPHGTSPTPAEEAASRSQQQSAASRERWVWIVAAGCCAAHPKKHVCCWRVQRAAETHARHAEEYAAVDKDITKKLPPRVTIKKTKRLTAHKVITYDGCRGASHGATSMCWIAACCCKLV
jgi:hypothetical protein